MVPQSTSEPVVASPVAHVMAEPNSSSDVVASDKPVTASPTANSESKEPSTTAPKSTAPTADNAPCRTLYLRGLDEKRKPAVLRPLLHALFTAYGEIEWIACSRAIALRGQAFITFTDLESATSALRRLQGVSFLDRPLQLAYARSETLRPQGKKALKEPRPRPRPQTTEPKAKRVRQNPKLAPNRILFAQQVSSVKALSERCARFAGFVEVRPVPGKPTIAFVEFATEQHAAVAVAALNGTAIEADTEPVQLAYAKK